MIPSAILRKKKKNVSCEYDQWVVETQLCECYLSINYSNELSQLYYTFFLEIIRFTISSKQLFIDSWLKFFFPEKAGGGGELTKLTKLNGQCPLHTYSWTAAAAVASKVE